MVSYEVVETQSRAHDIYAPIGGIPTGVIIPLYVYPGNIYTNPDYDGVIAQLRAHPSVPAWIILNPADGAGPVVDGNYTVAIRRLKAAGAHVIGYIATNYLAVPYATATAEVDKWLNLYPAVDGIFVDEMSNVPNVADVNYYRDLTDYCHARGLHKVVGNPGAGSPSEFFDTVTSDVIVIYENTTYPAEATLAGNYGGGYADFPVTRRGALVYNQPFDAAQVAMMSKYVGFIYVTADLGANPWDTVSGHLGLLMDALDSNIRASTTKPTITGSRGDGSALADLLTKLAALGLVIDTTTV